MFALLRNLHQLEEAKADLLSVSRDREVLEKRVKGLRSGSLDLDLLDEQARNMLGLARSNEVVFVWPEDTRQPQ